MWVRVPLRAPENSDDLRVKAIRNDDGEGGVNLREVAIRSGATEVRGREVKNNRGIKIADF